MPASKSVSKKKVISDSALAAQYLQHVWVDLDDFKPLEVLKPAASKRSKKTNHI